MGALWVTTAMLVPELAVDAIEHFEHEPARRSVESAGGLVAQEDLGLLDDRARDGDPLLLAARHLRRIVVAPRGQPDQIQRLVGRHGPGREVRDERDVLARREARDEVVELEDEADVRAPVLRQLLLGRVRQIVARVGERARRSARRGRRGC